MTPQDKARELFEQYDTYVVTWSGGFKVEKQNCKQYALIAVDKIINETKLHDKTIWEHGRTAYWQQVKQEIEKL